MRHPRLASGLIILAFLPTIRFCSESYKCRRWNIAQNFCRSVCLSPTIITVRMYSYPIRPYFACNHTELITLTEHICMLFYAEELFVAPVPNCAYSLTCMLKPAVCRLVCCLFWFCCSHPSLHFHIPSSLLSKIPSKAARTPFLVLCGQACYMRVFSRLPFLKDRNGFV